MNQSMSKDNCEKLINLLIENNYSGTINLGSGESLTYEFLPFFVDSLLNGLPEVKFRILSNGMLFSSKLSEFFFSSRVTWGITLDGFYNSELQNLQKGVDIEIVKDNIISVCEAGFSGNLYLNYTMNNQNVKSLKDYIDFASKLNIPKLFTTEIKIYEGFKHLDKYRLSENDKSFIKEMKKYAQLMNFKYAYFDTAENEFRRNKCFNHQGYVSPIIDMDCSVAFCYGQEDKLLGNIFEAETFMKWNSLYEKLKSNENAAENWCEKCSSLKDESDYFSVPLSLNPYLILRQ